MPKSFVSVICASGVGLLLMSLCAVSSSLRAQKLPTAQQGGRAAGAATVRPEPGFTIQPGPIAYLKFDHIGPGIPRGADEPAQRIWLRLVNNCRLPIVVGTISVPDGSPKGEEQLMNESVVAFDFERGIHGIGILANGTTEPKILKNATPEELPHQYGSDAGMQRPIASGKELQYSDKLCRRKMVSQDSV